MIEPTEKDKNRRVILRNDEDRGVFIWGVEPFGGNPAMAMVKWDSDGKHIFTSVRRKEEHRYCKNRAIGGERLWQY